MLGVLNFCHDYSGNPALCCV